MTRKNNVRARKRQCKVTVRGINHGIAKITKKRWRCVKAERVEFLHGGNSVFLMQLHLRERRNKIHKYINTNVDLKKSLPTQTQVDH